uniref:GF24314 n=1 Tax=uncultured marine virus TaxID=186617 RepID=A0A0F7LA50_9VIRU|nr:GF24314 [uncultured marine virus]
MCVGCDAERGQVAGGLRDGGFVPDRQDFDVVAVCSGGFQSDASWVRRRRGGVVNFSGGGRVDGRSHGDRTGCNRGLCAAGTTEHDGHRVLIDTVSRHVSDLVGVREYGCGEFATAEVDAGISGDRRSRDEGSSVAGDRLTIGHVLFLVFW